MELHYRTYGTSGTPLIILHGILGSSDNWQTIGRSLGEHYHVFTPDQRNHGRSFHSEEMNYAVLAGDIVQFCAQHKLSRVILAGHSMGGKVAMLAALLHPELVERLIVVDIAPVNYTGGHEDILFAMAEAPLASSTRREEIDRFLQPRIHDFAVRQFILKNLSRDEKGVFQWKCNLPVIISKYRLMMDFPVCDPQFDGPVHFIRGDRSAYINERNWPACLHYFPKAQLHTVPGAGHWVHAEQPKLFMDDLLASLNEKSR